MKRCLALLAIAALTCVAQRPRLTRATFATVEKSFDHKLETPVENPFPLLGNTRGVYLEGYGTVFTTEINLVAIGTTLFRPAYNKEEIARLRQRKLDRLPELRKLMREMLVNSAVSLDSMPGNEIIVLAVLLFHHNWEDIEGLPSQIIMKAQRQKLLSVRGKPAAIETVVTTQEF